MKDTTKYPLVLFLVCAAAGLALSVTFALTYDTIQLKDRQKAEKAIISAFWNVESPDGVSWNNFGKLEGTEDVYVAWKDSSKTEVLGYAAQGEAKGYSSTVKVMVGVQPVGPSQYRILGMKVVAQQETPGLGARVSEVESNQTVWTALASVFEAGEGEKPEVTPELEAAARELGVSAEAFPARPAFQSQFAGKLVSVKDGKLAGLNLEPAGKPADEHIVDAISGATISSKAVTGAVRSAIIKINNAVETTQKN